MAEEPLLSVPTKQYLAFCLGDEHYGIDILRVQEIKRWRSVALVPNTPDAVCGVINMRGAIIPVVDLRIRFEMVKKKPAPTTVIIVLSVEENQMSRTMAIVVDSVSDVDDINLNDIKPSPDFGDRVETAYISGLVTSKGKMMMLLDIDLLLATEALA
ncbi:UNVERIFIED_CONTAM: hypothetical protein GTU68_047616 [Idotea baltica]|nr:hypothetical protein [Idotea baltica]